MLERYIHLIKTADEDNEKVHDVFSEMIASNEVTPGVKMYYCKKCNVKFQQIQELRKHVVNHIKKSWPLPKTRPYICPECYYEAHTYMSLFKHVGVKHGGQEFKKIYKDSPVGQKQLEPMTSNGTVQIQVKHIGLELFLKEYSIVFKSLIENLCHSSSLMFYLRAKHCRVCFLFSQPFKVAENDCLLFNELFGSDV